MKVELEQIEIKEAVQFYINAVLGSALEVTDVKVVQGRESGSRIELELVAPINTKFIQTQLDKKATVELPQVEVVKAVEDVSENTEITVTEPDPIPVEEPVKDEPKKEELKSKSDATTDLKPLPGSFFN